MIAALLALAVSAAEPQTGRWLVYGAGTTTCGARTADKEAGSSLRQFKVQWLQGFLSGVNMTMLTQVGSNVADSSDSAGYTAWIDNYCAANPLEPLYSAAASLGAEMLERKIGR